MSSSNTALEPPAHNGSAALTLPRPSAMADQVVLDCHIKDLHYGTFKAVRDTSIPIRKNAITAFIGPSGCGKSTVLRCLNRMNDLVRGFRFDGHVRYRGRDIYKAGIDPVAVGMARAATNVISRSSLTASQPNGSRRSRSTSPTGSSRPHGGNSSSPMLQGMSNTPAIWRREPRPPILPSCWSAQLTD